MRKWEMAGGRLTGSNCPERGLFRGTAVGGAGAARAETAAARRVHGREHFAGDRGRRMLPRPSTRDRRQERSGVGMAWSAVEHRGRCQLNDLAHVHDGDPVADLPHQAQVVRDEQVGDLQLPAKAIQQVQVLPDPDSPTMPTVLPRRIDMFTSRTTVSQPPPTGNWTPNPLTATRSGRDSFTPDPLRSSGRPPGAQGVSEQIQGQHGQEERDRGHHQQRRRGVDVLLAHLDHVPPARRRRRDADTEEAE